VRLNERFAIDGAEITNAELDAAIETVRDLAEDLIRQSVISAHPTFLRDPHRRRLLLLPATAR